jgi:hypothetical protein
MRICKILGKIQTPSPWKMPRKVDIIWYFLKAQSELVESYGKFKVTAKMVIDQAFEDVMCFWRASTLPRINDKSIRDKIETIYKSYKRLLIRQSKSLLRESEIDEFRSEMMVTFDACACKCTCDLICLCICGMTEELCDFWRDQKKDRLRTLSVNARAKKDNDIETPENLVDHVDEIEDLDDSGIPDESQVEELEDSDEDINDFNVNAILEDSDFEFDDDDFSKTSRNNVKISRFAQELDR